jgi:diguanylate cyclase (GGDEF)-like protein
VPARVAARLTLFGKFVLVMLPAFMALAAGALWMAGRMDTRVLGEALALRVGNQTARVAAIVGRHEALARPRLAEDFLGAFGADVTVICAELRGASGERVASYPPAVGCAGAGVDAAHALTLPVGDDDATLLVHYTSESIAEEASRRALVLVAILAAGIVVAMASASLGFRLIVGRRLSRWHRALRLRSEDRDRTDRPVDPGGRDELGELIVAYNALVARERSREREMLELNQRLQDLSQRDPLTGLFNRRHFEAWVTEGGDFDRRRRSAVLALIDIDRFKSINDTHGHVVGDAVLEAFGRRLTSVARSDDRVVRWGGEEFLILAPGLIEAASLASRLLEAVRAERFPTSAGALRVTASIGLVRLPIHVGDYQLSIERAIVLADRALYAAKAAGRDRAIAIESLAARLPGQLAMLEDDLLRAAGLGLVNLSMIGEPVGAGTSPAAGSSPAPAAPGVAPDRPFVA